ncbi:MAG: hypothetical protein ACQES2_00935 [Pseudomonadota bacterium]
MINRLFAILLMVPVLATAGTNGGVRAPNGEVGANFQSGDEFDSSMLNAIYNGGSGDNVGFSLFTDFTTSEDTESAFEADRFALGGTLYTRDFLLGKLGITYRAISSDYTINGAERSTDEKEGSGFGILYMDRGNLTFTRTVIDSDVLGELDTADLKGDFYVTPNFKTSLSAGWMDADGHYGASLEHQPEFLENQASFTLNYKDEDGFDYFGIGFNYFFDTRVSLKVRDQQYR